MELKRSIGTIGLLFSAIGGIVGSGWLLGPFLVAQFAGPAAILSWVIGGLLMMVIALTYAELSSMLPIAGGTIRFLQFSHGTLAGYTIGWMAWIASAAVAPIETMALLHYAEGYLPWVMHKVAGVHVLTTPGLMFAAVLLFAMCVINIVGVKILSKTNNLVVTLKLLVPTLTFLVLVSMSFHSSNFHSAGFMPMGIKGVLAALPSAGVIFSFIGYSPAIQLAGEAKNPQRAIPFAILGALVMCIVLYTLLQVAFIGAVNPASFAHGWQHLSFSGDAGPFAGIAVALGAIWLSKILFIDAALSPFGTALIYTGSTARMTYAMGKNGYLPHSLMKMNRFGIPARIILLNFVIGLVLFLPFPSWQSMMSFLVSALVLAYTVGPLALGVLRKQIPQQKRPFKVPVHVAITLVGFYICNLIIFWTGWKIVSSMLVAIVIGYIVLALYRLTKSGRALALDIQHGWWLPIYLGCMGLLSYLGSFGGGKNFIVFGWDFVAIAGLSLVFFFISQKAGMNEFDESHMESIRQEHQLDEMPDTLATDTAS